MWELRSAVLWEVSLACYRVVGEIFPINGIDIYPLKSSMKTQNA